MLRTLFVLGLIVFGSVHALRGPFYALLFYLWIAYFRPQEWVWDGPIQTINLSLYVGVYVVLVSLLSGQAFRLSWRSALLMLFLAHSLVSTLSSPYVEYAWPFWYDFLKSTTIAVLIGALVTDVSRLRLVFLVIALSLGFEAAKQGWAQFVLIPGEKNYNEIRFLGDNNGVAVGMFMLVPMVVALIQTVSNRKWRWPLVGLLVGVVYRGISTFSRGGLLTGIAVAGVYLLRAKRRVPAIAAIATVSLLILPVLSDEFWDRMSSITQVSHNSLLDSEASGDVVSTVSRLHFWQVALRMAEANLVLGVGHNAYVAAYNDYDFLNGAFGKGKSVHNSWLGVLSELGIPGAVLFVTIWFLSLRTCWQVRRRARASAALADLVPFAAAIETGLIAFAVGGTFVIFQYTEMLWHFLGLSIALQRLAAARLEVRAQAPVPQAPVMRVAVRSVPS